MSLLRQSTIQSYPRIKIEPTSLIKPCLSTNSAKDVFTVPTGKWRNLFHVIKDEGLLWILNTVSTIDVECKNKYCSHGLKAAQFLALALLKLHQMYKTIYGYFCPYSMLSDDKVCDTFSRCFEWSSGVIRAFAWHSSYDRCAVAISNDYVHIYESNRTQILRHHNQRKIVDMAWHPEEKDLLVVATQTNLILWQMPGTHNPKVIKIIHDLMRSPITCIKFGADDNLFVCSPKASSIKKISLMNTNEQHISQITNWNLHGVTKISWSPNKTRMATATTSHFFKVYESQEWSSNKWSLFNSYVVDFVWSRPSGKFLLIAPSDEPCLYVLPFLEDSMANDVGGTKSIMKALDLTEQLDDDGNLVGGRVKSLVWDKNGKRLAISFQDNPDSVLLFKTSERPTVAFQQIGVVKNYVKSTPLLMEFHDKFKDGSLLTICWSDGNCQHVPMIYSTDQQSSEQTNRPRCLTNFCQSSSLMKIKKKAEL